MYFFDVMRAVSRICNVDVKHILEERTKEVKKLRQRLAYRSFA